MALQFRRSWSDPDLDQYRDTVVRFIEEHMLPGDDAARQRGHVGHELWRTAGQTGLLCTDVPEQWGGAGGDFRHEAVFYEEMARRTLTGMNASVHTIVAHYLLNHGTDDQKRRYLPRMVSGECVGAIAMTEPGTGSDLQGIRARAERKGDGYVINGSKTFISNGFLAGLVLVVVKTDPAQGARGTSIFIVETTDCPGYRVGRAFVDRCVEDLVAGRLDTATASMAKLWGSEAQGRVVDTCVQLFGGYGYMNEYLVARMYTDARIQRIYGGTSEIMKEVIARAL
jgi:acyl-CoA dehydrogenase